jgi:hypothetical protein
MVPNGEGLLRNYKQWVTDINGPNGKLHGHCVVRASPQLDGSIQKKNQSLLADEPIRGAASTSTRGANPSGSVKISFCPRPKSVHWLLGA